MNNATSNIFSQGKFQPSPAVFLIQIRLDSCRFGLPDTDSGSPKSSKIRIKINQNHMNIIFLKKDVTLLLNAHKKLAHN